jgi:hypothetical protein
MCHRSTPIEDLGIGKSEGKTSPKLQKANAEKIVTIGQRHIWTIDLGHRASKSQEFEGREVGVASRFPRIAKAEVLGGICLGNRTRSHGQGSREELSIRYPFSGFWRLKDQERLHRNCEVVNSEIPIGLRLWSYLWSYGRGLREELAVGLGSNQSSGFHIFWVLGLYHANTPEVSICERRLLAWPEVITSWTCGGEDSCLVHIYAGGVLVEDVWIV